MSSEYDQAEPYDAWLRDPGYLDTLAWWQEPDPGYAVVAAEQAQAKALEDAKAAAKAAEAEAARKAEEDRKRQEEENRRRAEEEAARIRANAPFRKPIGPRLSLTNKESGDVNNMTIKIPPGLSSSTVILSRDIIGKVVKGAALKKEPMKAQAGTYTGTVWEPGYTGNLLVPEDPKLSMFDLLTTPRTYVSAFPDKDYPEVWVKGRPRQTLTYVEYHGQNAAQIVEREQNIMKFQISPNPPGEESVIMWNPSETKGQNGAVAINYKTHGALTKVFMKPTIPFEIRYEPVPLLSTIDAPAPAPK
jgi:hypothetical protein